MASNPDIETSDSTHAERLQSALLFIKSLQEHVCDNTDDANSSEHSSRATTIDPSSKTTTMAAPHAPAVVIDRRRSSIRENHMSSSRTYSPRCSICPYEWDGEPGVSKAKIYRLNPSPGEGKRRLVVSQAEVDTEVEVHQETEQ